MEQQNSFASLHELLAKEHGIDTYSYLYEVMQETEVEFSNANGLPEKFLKSGNFDLEGFTAGWQEHNVIARLQPVALQVLGIDNLDQHPDMKNALIQAYHLGRQP